jgi:Flp pilus assembly protein TadD
MWHDRRSRAEEEMAQTARAAQRARSDRVVTLTATPTKDPDVVRSLTTTMGGRHNRHSASRDRRVLMLEVKDEVAGPAPRSAERNVGDETDPATFHRNQAILASQEGRFGDAEAHARDALVFRPDDIDVLNELGVAVWRSGRAAEAEAIYRRACRLKETDFRILTNLGLALQEQGRVDEAVDSYRRALAAQPDSFDARMSLGVALSDQGRFDEASEWLDSALELQPDSAEAIQNRGMNAFRLGRLDEAITYYEGALQRRPDFAEVHRNLAHALLCRGEYQRGWPEYEWRLKCAPYPGYRINRTFWNGGGFAGRTILLHAEQGFGDTLQFIRFARMVKGRGGRVVVLCQGPLVQLISRTPGVDLAYDGSTLYEPDCQIHAPLLSVPAILGTTLETLPAHVPYLFNDVQRVARWRTVVDEALAADGCSDDDSEAPDGCHARPFLIGVAWQGNPARRDDAWRSVPLAEFAPLAELPGVRLVSLQAEHGLDQLGDASARFPILELPSRRRRDFLDTAAMISQVDLVVTPDTALAHLAGGLGARVWVALSTVPDWRWMTDRDNSPWYPTMRLFRQAALGDWADVFRRMALALVPELARNARAIKPTSTPVD